MSSTSVLHTHPLDSSVCFGGMIGTVCSLKVCRNWFSPPPLCHSSFCMRAINTRRFHRHIVWWQTAFGHCHHIVFDVIHPWWWHVDTHNWFFRMNSVSSTLTSANMVNASACMIYHAANHATLPHEFNATHTLNVGIQRVHVHAHMHA